MDELLPKLAKRMKAKNGLAVNARVWQEAHDYHHFQHQAHLLFSHGPGIVTGLEVNVEPDTRRVWIQPGLAINVQGQIIVLEEQMSMEIDPDHVGLIYLYLTGSEEQEEGENGHVSNKDPFYLRQGYALESGLSLPPTAIELARVRLSDQYSLLTPAPRPEQPEPDEVDLRFRSVVGARLQPMVAVGIGYLGSTDIELPKYGAKAGQLARALSHLTHYQVWIDDDIPLTAGLEPYSLVYVVEQGAFDFTEIDGEAMQAHIQAGGTLFIESYADESALLEFLTSQQFTLTEQLPDDLLVTPFLFGEPPPGFNMRSGIFQVGEGVIFSTLDYGHLWQRTPDNAPTRSREAIRAAVEWAANLVTFAVQHRHQFQA